MDIELDEKEFVALNAKTIRKLLASGDGLSSELSRSERRSRERWPFDAPVQLWATDPTGEELQLLATCQNMNEDGVGLLCDRPFAVGTVLPIAIHRADATYHGKGVVRHCTVSGDEYFVGIELIGDGS